MSRAFLIWCLAAATALTGCDKKSPTTASTPQVGSSAPASADHVISTGALDFNLVERGGKFVLQDDAWELTFPRRPEVSERAVPAPNGLKFKTLIAMATQGDTDAYGITIDLVPENVQYDITTGMRATRDGAIKGAGAKLVREEPVTIGGLEGRKAICTTRAGGRDINMELYVAFDRRHRAMISLITATADDQLPAATKAFLASFVVKDGEAPPPGDGT